mgnify:CR=1 FL=1|jgi:UMP-CMP kinase 2, mitochondrial
MNKNKNKQLRQLGRFIVIDGLDAVGKTTLTRKLAQTLGAEELKCPPQIVAPSLLNGDLRKHFDKQPPTQRRAYYRFANLIAGEQARIAVASGKDVVIDRYWTSTVAFSALDPSSITSDNIDSEYPPEMLKPDIVILLTVDETRRTERLRGRGEPVTEEEYKLAHEEAGRKALLQAYRQFKPVEVDTSKLDPQGVLNAVLEILATIIPLDDDTSDLNEDQ